MFFAAGTRGAASKIRDQPALRRSIPRRPYLAVSEFDPEALVTGRLGHVGRERLAVCDEAFAVRADCVRGHATSFVHAVPLRDAPREGRDMDSEAALGLGLVDNGIRED